MAHKGYNTMRRDDDGQLAQSAPGIMGTNESPTTDQTSASIHDLARNTAKSFMEHEDALRRLEKEVDLLMKNRDVAPTKERDDDDRPFWDTTNTMMSRPHNEAPRVSITASDVTNTWIETVEKMSVSGRRHCTANELRGLMMKTAEMLLDATKSENGLIDTFAFTEGLVQIWRDHLNRPNTLSPDDML